jgi:DNA polymerase-2
LPLLHRAGFVAPNGHLRDDIEPSPGGFVMDSRPGMYRHVLVLDFKSLYPSIIRSFKIDPLGMALGLLGKRDQSELVPGFKGAWFVKQGHLLPGLIAELWQAREQAKKAKDSALSQAIKILMNSFYGVLGSPGCRFFDARLASSITRRGHQIIQQTAKHINQLRQPGIRYQVIYGDTDSVFVWLQGCDSDAQAKQQGSLLQQQLNRWWQQRLQREYGVDSALEIEFETHFSRFFMPTIRGSEQGSKKRYAGVVGEGDEAKLVFKGLETVRTDWTPLARNFQRELYRRIFFEQPYRDFIRAEVAALLAGKRDDQLYYRKRLRRKLEQYQRNIPPHVQAARKSGQRYRRGDWVRYRVTHNGAEPEGSVYSAIDYQHYIDRQLAPVADSILQFSGETLAAIIDRQLSFF